MGYFLGIKSLTSTAHMTQTGTSLGSRFRFRWRSFSGWFWVDFGLVLRLVSTLRKKRGEGG